MAGSAIDPATDPDIGAALFLTRWITHMCAPVFVFLAGTSAGLMAARKRPSALGRFLLERGVWLILIEWFVVSNARSFAPLGVPQLGGLIFVGMQVIWAIGASMVVLPGAQFFGRRTCAVVGGAIVVCHNLLNRVWPVTSSQDSSGPLWAALHSQVGYAAGPFLLRFSYPLLPWAGVMLLGYGTAWVFKQPPVRRNRLLLVFGVTTTVAFLVLRTADVYGDPNPWQMSGSVVRTVIDYLNTTKYPPSLLFLLMTLGPSAVFCTWTDRLPRRAIQVLVTFGRVPFAFYVAHLYLIHVLSVVLGVFQGFEASEFMTLFRFFPKGYGLGLPGVYLVWLAVVLLLYPFCAWVDAVKARRQDRWLSYV